MAEELSSVRAEHKFDETALDEYLKKNLQVCPRGPGTLNVLQYRFVFDLIVSMIIPSDLIYRLAYQLINFFDECLLWGNCCCFKACSILNLVVLLSLSLGASHSTTISHCYDPVVAQSRSEYHQPASKLSRALSQREGEKEGELANYMYVSGI